MLISERGRYLSWSSWLEGRKIRIGTTVALGSCSDSGASCARRTNVVRKQSGLGIIRRLLRTFSLKGKPLGVGMTDKLLPQQTALETVYVGST